MIVVVSPHLDDAALSVPGFIHARASAREPVLVLTVFSEGDATHHERRAEDHAALTLLGATALHLGLHDAPWRLGLASTFPNLVLRPHDPDDAATVTRTLVARLHDLAPTLTLLPLGVGEHIDHRIVHAAHSQLPGPLAFYEDRPYASVRHATRARLLRLAATLDDARVLPRPGDHAEFLAAARLAPHHRAYLSAAEREPCLRALAAPLTADPGPPRLHLKTLEPHTFPPETRHAAAQALQRYRSQLRDLFADEDPTAAFGPEYREQLYLRF